MTSPASVRYRQYDEYGHQNSHDCYAGCVRGQVRRERILGCWMYSRLGQPPTVFPFGREVRPERVELDEEISRQAFPDDWREQVGDGGRRPVQLRSGEFPEI